MKKFFTLRYFLICAFAGLLIAIGVMFLACDAFALRRPEGTVTLELTEKPDSDVIAEKLKEKGLITSKLWFKTYLKLRHKDFESTQPGSYEIPFGSGFDGIHRILSTGDKQKRTQVKVTIPEGSTVKDIIRIICDDYGICTEKELTEEIQNGDFSEYDFVNKIPEGRKYRLEGYLYPDTYFFYSDSSAHSVIRKLLSNFDEKFDSRYRAACRKNGISYDEAITLASIVIKEGKHVKDYPKISSVFHNRMKSPVFSGLLQSDATLVYELGREMKPEDKNLDSKYNTYRYKGLPPSPIASPDLNAISYAIYPEKTSYCYFVTDKEGGVLYASDYGTHLKNLAKVKNQSSS